MLASRSLLGALRCSEQVSHLPHHHGEQVNTTKPKTTSYLTSWIQMLKEEPRAILKALGAAKKAADLIAPEVTTGEA